MGRKRRLSPRVSRRGPARPRPPPSHPSSASSSKPRLDRRQRQQQQTAPSSTSSSAFSAAPSSSASCSRVPGPGATVVPFSPPHRILLVGEGDLSFAVSLVRHHGCTNVTATVLERDAAALAAKYPDTAAANALLVSTASSENRVLYGVDVHRRGSFSAVVPAKKKRKAAGSGPDDNGRFDRIVFNFPHVGGKSTDVNRQVRSNQQLLVAFFERARPALASGGAVVVTIFEGEPYTLWNIRDLGRHCGLRLERSFRFRPDAYPGYHHSRTLGIVRSRRTGEAAAGAWRGEERPARSFVFVDIDQEQGVGIEGVSFVPRKKRRREEDEDEDEEEEEEEEERDDDDGEEGDGDSGADDEDDDGGDNDDESGHFRGVSIPEENQEDILHTQDEDHEWEPGED